MKKDAVKEKKIPLSLPRGGLFFGEKGPTPLFFEKTQGKKGGEGILVKSQGNSSAPLESPKYRRRGREGGASIVYI